MDSLPLHPAVVHLPLGLSLILPPLAAGLWWSIRRNWLPMRTWLIFIALQASLVGAGIVSLNTGESEEERVERVVAEARIDRHEERAEVFMIGAGSTLALATLALAPLGGRTQRAIAAGTVLASTVVLVLGLRVGHSGGELVYKDGAAGAYLGPESLAPGSPGGEHDD